MSEVRRGLGRGLQALLGEPAAADLASAAPPPAQGSAVTPMPRPGAWIPPTSPVASPSATAEVVAHPASAPSASAEAVTLRPAPAPGDEGGPQQIDLDMIERNPNQPRRTFDEAELEDLANSIRSRGLLQPILVRPLADKPGRFQIVAGERRFRAAQKVGLKRIPAVVRFLDEAEILEIGIIENVQRVDLNPLEEAMGYQALIDRFGRTQQEIAEIVGKSRPHIANTLRLLSLPDEIQNMVRQGQLTAGHARAVLTAPDPMALATTAIEQSLNVREVERLAAKAKDERDGPRVSSGGGTSERDPDVIALEQRLAEALGMDVRLIRSGEGGGEVRLTFGSMAQLDQLCQRLTSLF